MRQNRLLFLAVAIVSLAILDAAILAARPVLQETSPLQAAPAPTFQARTRLVEVDVIVRDKNGPVTGLNQDDFTLLDNGKPQKVSVFSVKGTQSLRQSAVPLPAGSVSNRVTRNGLEAASSTVVLIDRLNTPQDDQHYANQKIVKFLETRRSQDRLGIYAFGNGLRVVQDLTDDPERLSRAINSLKPRNENRRTLYTPGPFEQSEPEMSGRALEEFELLTADEKVSSVKQVLEAIARHLAPVPGRKSLIWVTGSFPLLLKTAHETRDFSSDMNEAARALNDANVALYAVDARGLVYGGSNPRSPWGLNVAGIDTMNKLAGLTGGKAFYADNGIDSLIAEAVEDSELIYTLGFYPSQESQNGDWHKLKVSVAKRGVTTRYREAYFAPNVVTAAQRPTLDQMLKDTLDAAEIGLRADTAPDQARPGFYNVHATVDLHDVHLEHRNAEWVGGVDISLYMSGAKSAFKLSRKFEIPDSQLAAALEAGMIVDASVRVTESTGELRVVVQDASTGAGGSVRVPLGRN